MDDTDHQLIREARVAVFDFDRTLARFRPDWLALKEEVATRAATLGYPGRFVDAFDLDLRALRSQAGEDVFRSLCEVVADHEALGFDPGSIDETMLGLLLYRQQGQKPIAVFSANTRAALTAAFADPAWCGVDPFIVGKEDVTRGKPHGEGLARVAVQFKCTPSDMVFVGDSDDDHDAAEHAGVPFVRTREID